jgi:lysozyme
MLTGTDISTWQDTELIPGEVDFVKMKNAGADFVIFKVSQSTFKDQVFMDSWIDAKGILPRGGYHWLSWNKTGLEQAKYFCDALSKDMPEILHPVIDFEDRIGVPQNANGHLWNALDYIEDQLHLIGMIYTSPYYWMEFGSKDKAWARYPLWIANYYVTKPMIPAPWTNWTMWQYTPKGDGKKYGAESLQIDMDYFNGDMSQFIKWCGDPIAQPKTLEQRVATLESQAIEHGWVVG